MDWKSAKRRTQQHACVDQFKKSIWQKLFIIIIGYCQAGFW